MRKQTKLVAVLSAAALLAIGASMTSFAASGWAQEDGTWVYLDSSGDRVYDSWKKSGSSYFYLNEDGEMATNAIIDDGENKYYVDASGARVVNQWISVENEDNETIGDNEDISTIWYYFGSSGKANKEGVKTVNGKKYIFDDNGYMLCGWQEYENDLYYLGDENEGWAYTGWQFLEVQDDLLEEYDDEEWFYFKPSNGKAHKADPGQVTRKYIDGKYYSFDENGVMQDKWVVATPGSATGDSARYRADDGRQETGWVYAYPDNEEDGEDQFWYYLDSKGVPFNLRGADSGMDEGFLATAQKKDNEKWKEPITGVAAKVIKSKTYLFNDKGEMQTGVFLLIDVARTGGVSLGSTVDEITGLVGGIYYFNKDSGSTQGVMATGKATVSYDGDNYNYYFQKDGSAYRLYIADGALYDAQGERFDAEDGNSYQLVDVADGVKIRIKGSSSVIEGPVTMIVGSSGKVKKSGTVKLDGIKYTVKDYIVTGAEVVD